MAIAPIAEACYVGMNRMNSCLQGLIMTEKGIRERGGSGGRKRKIQPSVEVVRGGSRLKFGVRFGVMREFYVWIGDGAGDRNARRAFLSHLEVEISRH
jgi:hypothetical protein